MKSSRNNIAHIFPHAENSANNAFNYNGNNGNLNANDRNNDLSVRPLLELERCNDYWEALPIPSSEFYRIYRIAKQHKAKKPSHLFFEIDYPHKLRELCYEVNTCTYQPVMSVCFVITKPLTRQVIAADFRDRVVQTLLVQRLLPYLETHEHPHSFSCRIGKGALAAAQTMYNMYFEVSEGYAKDMWVCTLDFKSFFMSLDMILWTERLKDFIKARYKGDDIMYTLYLADRIFYSCPTEHCIRKGGEWIHRSVPEGKRLDGNEPYIGLPIGNVSSQMMANFITTDFLHYVEGLGFHHFVLYTDDITVFTTDKERLLASIPLMRAFAKEHCRLTLHPHKMHLQHFSKGFNALGYRFKFDNMTPSKRNVHNFKRRVRMLLNMERRDIRECYTYKERAISHLNAYLGLLKHSRSFRLRSEALNSLMESKWGELLQANADCTAVSIRLEKTRKAYLVKQNKKNRRTTFKILKEYDNNGTD